MDKTVTLLALTGPDAPKLLKTYTARTPQGRILKIDHPTHPTCLPIKKHHTYLGVIISYKLFERSTLKHRQQLAWQAFHRLKKFLTSNQVALKRRVLLWQTCVFTILQFGLTSVGVDDVSAVQLRGTVMRQLRCVAKSLGHLTHETNDDLLQRLGIPDPIESLRRLCSQRIAACAEHVGHLQPPRVRQWWSTVLAELHEHAANPPRIQTSLTEVTKVLRVRSTCPICSQQFPSLHAMRVHFGKEHCKDKPKKETNPTVKNQRKDEFRGHARDGQPICKHCNKSFHGWPAFMGHFSQEACPVLHHDLSGEANPHSLSQPDTSPTATQAGQPQPDQPSAQGVPAPGRAALAQHDIVPLFHRPELQHLARENNIEALASAIKATNRQHYCPECNQKLTSPKYLTRHALKMHPPLAAVQQSVKSWLTAKFRPSSPCKWCHEVFATRSQLHIVSCSVMWTCGQMIAKQGSIQDRSQTTLQDVYPDLDSSAGRSSGRVRQVLGLHEAGRALPSELDSTLHGSYGSTRGPAGPGGRRGQAETRWSGSYGIHGDRRDPELATGSSGEIPENGRQRGAEGLGDHQRRDYAAGSGAESPATEGKDDPKSHSGDRTAAGGQTAGGEATTKAGKATGGEHAGSNGPGTTTATRTAQTATQKRKRL